MKPIKSTAKQVIIRYVHEWPQMYKPLDKKLGQQRKKIPTYCNSKRKLTGKVENYKLAILSAISLEIRRVKINP